MAEVYTLQVGGWNWQKSM